MKPTDVAGQTTLAAVNGLAAIYERQAIALEIAADAAVRLADAHERIAMTLAAWAYADVIAEANDFKDVGGRLDVWGDLDGKARVRAILDQATTLAPVSAKSKGTRP